MVTIFIVQVVSCYVILIFYHFVGILLKEEYILLNIISAQCNVILGRKFSQ
jgi:hypothetical protein